MQKSLIMNAVNILFLFIWNGVIFLLDFDKISKFGPIILPKVLLGLYFNVKGTQIYKSVYCYRQNINFMAIYIYISRLCNIYSSLLINLYLNKTF